MRVSSVRDLFEHLVGVEPAIPASRCRTSSICSRTNGEIKHATSLSNLYSRSAYEFSDTMNCVHAIVRKAVFPAAGLGIRFPPVTKAQPKEMLPLVDKPIIQYGVEEAVEAGIENIILVTGQRQAPSRTTSTSRSSSRRSSRRAASSISSRRSARSRA